MNSVSRISGFVILFVFCFYSETYAASELTLNAELFGTKLWTLTYSSINEKECEIKLAKKRSKLNQYECQRLENLFAEFKKEKSISVRPPEVPVDAAVYEIKFNNNTVRSLLQAPKSCQIQENGELKCTDVILTAAQKVVLELIFFKAAKFN